MPQVHRNILFVDDQPEVTEALQLAFYRKPFRVYTANSGEAALEILSSKCVDVVVSDEQMPGMCGSQFLTVVRRKYPNAIRIILSGHANFRATIAAINEAGAHHFLMKPCSPDEIAQCITRILDEQEQRPFADPGAARENASLEAMREFDEALAALWVAFQPVIRTEESEVFAYEALVRSNHPELKTPGLLFQAAERLDRVVELEGRVRELTSLRMEELPAEVCVMVNIHPRSLTDKDLYSSSCALFQHRRRVIFEITERDKLHEVADAVEGLTTLRELGYRVAVDDLGAGYSGLNTFALIRPDIVKFDMELVRNIQESTMKCDLVRVIVTFCKEMGILTVAEGIETGEEFETVRDLGCDLLQGFFIARPAINFERPTAVQRHLEVVP